MDFNKKIDDILYTINLRTHHNFTLTYAKLFEISAFKNDFYFFSRK